MKPIINKWQFTLSQSRDYLRMESGWRIITFGIFNFIHLPYKGETYNKDDYKGFIIRLRVWIPIEIL